MVTLTGARVFVLTAAMVSLAGVLVAYGARLARLERAVEAIAKATPAGSRPASSPVEEQSGEISLGGAALKGSRDAPVALVEYTDFHCPYCRRFARESLPILEGEYIETGRLVFVVKHLPLTGRHRFARAAAEVSECANNQGRFWPMHDWLVTGPIGDPRLNLVQSVIGAVGLDGTVFAECVASGAGAAMIDRHIEEARTLRVTATPTFFVGLVRSDRVSLIARISGAQNHVVFQEVIDEALARSEDGGR